MRSLSPRAQGPSDSLKFPSRCHACGYLCDTARRQPSKLLPANSRFNHDIRRRQSIAYKPSLQAIFSRKDKYKSDFWFQGISFQCIAYGRRNGPTKMKISSRSYLRGLKGRKNHFFQDQFRAPLRDYVCLPQQFYQIENLVKSCGCRS